MRVCSCTVHLYPLDQSGMTRRSPCDLTPSINCPDNPLRMRSYRLLSENLYMANRSEQGPRTAHKTHKPAHARGSLSTSACSRFTKRERTRRGLSLSLPVFFWRAKVRKGLAVTEVPHVAPSPAASLDNLLLAGPLNSNSVSPFCALTYA